MPKNVILFERLMYTSLSIGLLILIVDSSRQAELAEVQAAGGGTFVAVVALAALGIFFALVWLIARKGKNWARWLFAALFVLGLWPFLQNVSVLLEASPLVALLSVAQIIIQSAALLFIFTGDAPPWFERAKAAA